MESITTNSNIYHSSENEDYKTLRSMMSERINTHAIAGEPLFTTNTENLYDVFLDNLPANRQHYNCHACRDFFNKYAGLVIVADDSGCIVPINLPVLPNDNFFYKAINSVRNVVMNSKINGIFLSEEKVWGKPVTGEWSHFYVIPDNDFVFKHSLYNASEMMARKKHEFVTLIKALSVIDKNVVKTAIQVLDTNQLYRSEKFIGNAEWLLNLINLIEANKRNKTNLVWRAIATAPAGFYAPRSSMIGTLLDDIILGLTFENIKRRFNAKMHPLEYQRPQAMPSEGNIKQAEEVVAKLGIAKSLDRRYAKIEDIHPLWLPKPDAQKGAVGDESTPVFGHLVKDKHSNAADKLIIPPKEMSWIKFESSVLKTAEKIEYYVESKIAAYAALLTCVDDTAPPILQWDHEEYRNPLSWYFYHGGSMPSTWNLITGHFANVNAIAMQPSMLSHNYHHGKGVMFVLDGCRDVSDRKLGNALFPEILKSELHGIRSTIEAYSRNAILQGKEEATACGLMIGSSNQNAWSVILRVTCDDEIKTYKINRWE